MEISRKQAARVLDTEEREMIDQTYHPALQDLADTDLSALVARVRERRDRAQAIASRRRREMRGKATPHGAAASREDGGSRQKADVLRAAMRRLNSEVERRRQMRARLDLVESQRRALEMAREAASHRDTPNTRTAHKGMHRKENRKAGRLGSVMEAGRVRKFVAVAQAKKDAR